MGPEIPEIWFSPRVWERSPRLRLALRSRVRRTSCAEATVLTLSFLEGARGSPLLIICPDEGEILGLEAVVEAEWPVAGVMS